MNELVGNQDSILFIKNLSKSYGPFNALKNINLEIKQNQITGLLGPNGAGKTTLVKSILSLVHFKEGSIKINGIDSKDPKSRSNLAYFPEKFNFYPFYTVENTLKFLSSLNGLDPASHKERFEMTLEKFSLTEIRFKKLDSISKGQLQRTGLASIYLSEKEFLIFDEPFSGLDPVGIRELKDLFIELKVMGRTLIICSHILSEIEKICDDVVILDRAQIKHQGSISDISNLEDFFLKLVKGENT